MDEACKDFVELCEAIDTVRVIGEASESLEAQYDIKTAIQDIKLYVNHLIQDVQQKKAKAFAFDSLDEASCFWLKDYCQKILPVKFCEGQTDYFGKKGMTLHVDIIFTIVNMMQKITQHQQTTQANFLYVNKVYAKSGKASCYNNSLGPEALYRLYKNNGIDLCRYDFNQPCTGEDQCDWETANAKTILRSYLQAKSDILTADDIVEGMYYGFGIQSAIICVAVSDKTKASLTGKKTKNFTSYHSFESKETRMMAWRYFGIGKGVFI